MAPTEILAEQHAMTIARLFAATRFRVAALTEHFRRGASPHRRRPGARRYSSGHRHARAAAGRRRVQQARTGDHRRAASLRRRAAIDAASEGQSRRARDGGHADPAHAGAHDLRRSRRLRDSPGPEGRKPVKTTVRPESRRDEVWEFVRESAGKRASGVCHLSADRTAKGRPARATAMAEHLSLEVFPEFRVALLHGKMKPRRRAGDGRVRRVRSTCWSPRPSSKLASTCRTRR